MFEYQNRPSHIGILVGGGPAPGINGVISAVTIEARKRNLPVTGFYDGYEWLAAGDLGKVREMSTPLQISDVSRVHFEGGSILRTSRANPKNAPNGISNCAKMLHKMGITHLVSIGGNGTICVTWLVAKAAREQNIPMKFVHVPKTIDNDLPLPKGINTFGFATAAHVGTGYLKNLMREAKTINRWMMAVTMGRHTGHLALAMAKAAGATLAIIPEEFDHRHTSISELTDIIESTIIKRKAMGHRYGVIVLAEGLSELLSDQEIMKIPGAKNMRNPSGGRLLAEVDLGKGIKLELERRYKARDQDIRIAVIEIGYLLRCAEPIPADLSYTRDLGFSATHYLLSRHPEHQAHAMICINNDGELLPVPLDDVIDPVKQRARLHRVDTSSYGYHVAQEYMLRLRRRDLEDLDFLKAMCQAVRLSPEAFCRRYGYLIRD